MFRTFLFHLFKESFIAFMLKAIWSEAVKCENGKSEISRRMKNHLPKQMSIF